MNRNRATRILKAFAFTTLLIAPGLPAQELDDLVPCFKTCHAEGMDAYQDALDRNRPEGVARMYGEAAFDACMEEQLC